MDFEILGQDGGGEMPILCTFCHLGAGTGGSKGRLVRVFGGWVAGEW